MGLLFVSIVNDLFSGCYTLLNKWQDSHMHFKMFYQVCCYFVYKSLLLVNVDRICHTLDGSDIVWFHLYLSLNFVVFEFLKVNEFLLE